MRSILSTLILLSIINSGPAQTKRALFLGNSYTNSNNLPTLTSDLSESAGYTLITDSNTPGGYTFEGHTTNTTTIEKIDAGNWDFVVLQEQSQIPSFPIAQVESECFPYAAQLDAMINESNPCAETVFFMTWGRENGDSQNCANWPPVCTYEGMDDLLFERYMMMADDNDAIVSPVGKVWRHIRTYFPEIELYSSDGSHPSAAGSYAAACTFFCAIFRQDPTLCDYDYTLDAATAQTIREAARDIVYLDMLQWHIGEYDLQADFEYTVDSDYTVNFINTTSGDADFYWWLGESGSNDINPEYQYSGPGNYDIMLIAANGCEVDTLFETITILPVGVTEGVEKSFDIYPNPADESITLDPDRAGHWQIIDISGKEITRGYVAAPARVNIDVSRLSTGVYFFRHSGKDKKLVIK